MTPQVETCQWFLLCTNKAKYHVWHPVLGEVPCCERCAGIIDLKHEYVGDSDRCRCGGIVVYFEDGDKNGQIGHGCEINDTVFTNPKTRLKGH